MPHSPSEILVTPRLENLDAARIVNGLGLSISLLPSGAIFAIEHAEAGRTIMINQTLASPIANGMARLYLRIGGPEPAILPVIGPEAGLSVGAADDRFVWEGEQSGLEHRVTLWLHPRLNVWLWRVEVANRRDSELPCDAVFIQDLGLGDRGFLMNNEAYASQYLDHHVAQHPRLNHVVMSRQNLSQGGVYPWAAHGCLEGAAGFATDFRQVMGPAHRDADQFMSPFGTSLPSTRLQFETACAALQSNAATLNSRRRNSWTFFGFYEPGSPGGVERRRLEPDRNRRTRLRRLDAAQSRRFPSRHAVCCTTRNPPWPTPSTRKIYERAIASGPMSSGLMADFCLSLFRGGRISRHVVLRDKERIVARRHGALLRSGQEMLPDEAILCATCWMHGVFGAQLTIGNTSFHKLFSVSRDPYNITRASGLRMLVETKDGWRLLTVPSAFEMGLNDCRWIYRLGERTITVSADRFRRRTRHAMAGDRRRETMPLPRFRPLVLGEQEFAHAGRMEIDARRKQFAFRPDPDNLWGQKYPKAVYHLVTSTPRQVEAVGGDELLYADGKRRSGAYAAIRTRRTSEFVFAVVGSMTDPKRAEGAGGKIPKPVADESMLAHSDRFWRKVTRGIRVRSARPRRRR